MTHAALRLALVGALTAGALVGAAQVPPATRVPGAARPDAAAAAPAGRPLTRVDLACPGADRQGVTDGAAVPQQVSVLAATPPADVAEPGTGGARPLEARGVPGDTALAGDAVKGWTVTDAHSVRVSATGRLARAATALQLHTEGKGEQRTLAATRCSGPMTDGWLLAGGAQPGRQERLVLTNPGSAAATVDVTVLTGTAPAGGPVARQVVVPAQGRSVLLLDALAPGAVTPAVHVRVASGAVAATLTDSWLDGIVPRGGDAAVTSTAGTELVVPGVVGTGQAGTVQLRVAVPGDEEAVVEVKAWTPAGQRGVEHAVTRVPGGTVADVDVSDLPSGVSALVIHADVPVAAAAVTAVGKDRAKQSDLAWTAAVPAVTGLTGTPVPPGATASLAVSADDATQVTLYEVAADGTATPTAVRVPQTGTVEVPVTGASAWLRTSGTPVHAALVLRADDGDALLSVVPLAELPTTQPVVPVSAG